MAITCESKRDLPEDRHGLRGVFQHDVLQIFSAVGELQHDELLRLRLSGKQGLVWKEVHNNRLAKFSVRLKKRSNPNL